MVTDKSKPSIMPDLNPSRQSSLLSGKSDASGIFWILTHEHEQSARIRRMIFIAL
jgi:hypothetical protein